jgi:hypothetical protein
MHLLQPGLAHLLLSHGPDHKPSSMAKNALECA